LSCAVGLAVLNYLEKHRLIENVATLSDAFFRSAREILDHPMVGEIRGKGFFMGIELVADRATREPVPADRSLYRRVADEAFSRGLIIGANHGGIDGVRGDHVSLAPPFTCTITDLREALAILRDAIDIVGRSV
jgi:adenosylmethionine-8-amino-7-oxononanoate aminotransferase